MKEKSVGIVEVSKCYWEIFWGGIVLYGTNTYSVVVAAVNEGWCIRTILKFGRRMN